ncbi:MAG: D-glycero-beta-D-manno-heptose-7-phosphate kinase [Rhodospirillaceae bacterium]|nr:D-glycero-beta-D-manno-heptose-7-phosphate kinase [Rhodospirillaceae bacterium]|tara:strand:+ start:1174 stop:2169 length:996 start_codon:yes stop_codon:yes gene_type:complete
MSNRKTYLDLITRLGGKNIAVIGDVMLDRSFFGVAERFSAEAPIPIVDVKERLEQLGGAANVANNLSSLGDKPILFSVVGNDRDGLQLRKLIKNNVTEEQFIFTDDERPTTVKMRTFAQNRQIARADFESCELVQEDIWGKMTEALADLAPSLSAIIVEDYNKGLLSPPFIKKILKIARQAGVMVLVDPKFKNFFDYEGVTLFKPNLREISRATSMKVSSIQQIESAASHLLKKLNCEHVMVTMGKDGVGLVDKHGKFFNKPAFVRIVNDPAGAGDTVISVMASAMASGASAEHAMTIANYGGGLICEKVGIQPVTSDELSEAIVRHEADC